MPVNEVIQGTLRHPMAAIAIFVFTFVLISFRKLKILPIGRPAGALLGAVLMVCFGVVTPKEAYSLINWDTICLLLGMMIIAEYLREAKLFAKFSGLFEKINSPFVLLCAVCIVAGLASSILVNDPVCVVLTPLVLEICFRKKLNPFPYLVVLATGSNIGSALTLTGNPQNMIIGSISKLSFIKFTSYMLLPFIVCVFINLLLAYFYYGNKLKLENSEPENFLSDSDSEDNINLGTNKNKVIAILGLIIACIGFISGSSMAFSALAGAALVIVLNRKDPAEIFAKIEWSLLLFFASLFVVIGGLQTSGLATVITEKSLALIAGSKIEQISIFTVITLVGSNLLSNVPFVLLASSSVAAMQNSVLFWYLLAFVSTIAGNLTLFGSVANMIVAEEAGDKCKIEFWAFAKFGIVSTLLCIIAGTIVLSILL